MDEMDKWECVVCKEETLVERGKKPLSCENPNCRNRKIFKALTGPYQFFEGEKFIPAYLVDELKRQQHYHTHLKTREIWVYNGGSYVPDGEQQIDKKVRELLYPIYKENHTREAVSGVRGTTYTPPEKFDAPPNLINVKNGILNTETREFKPHTPDIIFIQQLPIEYNPQADCPRFKQFLTEVLQEDDIPLMQELFGYTLRRTYEFAIAVMLLGEGENGKSTLLNVLRAMLGEENVATPSLQDLLNDRFAKAQLYGKLANIHADLPDTKLSSTGTFKMLTGQDLIYAQQKHRDPFTFQNYAKLFYSANALPFTRDKTRAFWRRWIVIKFPRSFGPNEADPHLLEKLTQELPGILNWALEGLDRLLKQGQFTYTQSRENVEKEWIRMTDSLRAFVTTCVVTAPGEWVSKDDFYVAYTKFCEENDLNAVSKNIVGRRLPTLISTNPFYPHVDGKQVHAWNNMQVMQEERSIPERVGNFYEYNRNSQKTLNNLHNGNKGLLSFIGDSVGVSDVMLLIEKALKDGIKSYKDLLHICRIDEKICRKYAGNMQDLVRVFHAAFERLRQEGRVIELPDGKWGLNR